MVNVGGGDADHLEKLDHKKKVVSGHIEKLLVPSNLIHGILATDNAEEKAKTNLLQPGHQFFQRGD